MFTEIFKAGKWTVSINARKTELMFTNEYEADYAYLDRNNGHFRFDRAIVPNYVKKKALRWAMQPGNMISIYSDNN